MDTKEKEHLGIIIGEQLSSVEFVQDYLQLHFEDSNLICYTWPKIYTYESVYIFGDTEYRNKLCEFISHVVDSVKVSEKEVLIITFQETISLQISLSPMNSQKLGEIAIFYGKDGNWSVFE